MEGCVAEMEHESLRSGQEEAYEPETQMKQGFDEKWVRYLMVISRGSIFPHIQFGLVAYHGQHLTVNLSGMLILRGLVTLLLVFHAFGLRQFTDKKRGTNSWSGFWSKETAFGKRYLDAQYGEAPVLAVVGENV